MFENNNQIKNDSINIILDVRNSSVGIAAWKNQKKPTIIYTDRQYILFEKEQENNEFINNIYNILNQTIDRFIKSEIFKQQNSKKVSMVLCALSSPWYKTNIKNISLQEKKQTKLTQDYLNNKINLDLNNQIQKESYPIENKIISICLNEYDIRNPIGKEFNEIKFSTYHSVMAKKTKEELEEKITKTFKTNNINFCTHSLAMISVLRNNFHSSDDYSLFDVGGEITQLINFKDGCPTKIIDTQYGFNYLIRNLSIETKEDLKNIFTLLKLSAENNLKDKNIEKKAIEISKKWFKEVVGDNKDTKTKIQQNIFITIDNALEPILKKVFSNRDFYSKVLNLNKEPIVRIINSQNTKNLAIYSDGITKDSILSILFNFQQLILNKIC